MTWLWLPVALLAIATLAQAAPVPEYGYRIVHTYPHDPEAFTQGFEYREGFLFEGTGLYGRSTLRKVELETGRVVHEISLDRQYFGEGITVLAGHITEITWKSHEGFVYDENNFRRLKDFHYNGEGWGLANDGHSIYFSDGTSQIRVLDGGTLAERRRITVHEAGNRIDRLNELEWVRGELYANIWGSDRIARIAPNDGHILGWIDLTGLLAAEDHTPQTDVLNGIAYDSAHDRLFVTGKLWPKVFQIELVRKSSGRSVE